MRGKRISPSSPKKGGAPPILPATVMEKKGKRRDSFRGGKKKRLSSLSAMEKGELRFFREKESVESRSWLNSTGRKRRAMLRAVGGGKKGATTLLTKQKKRYRDLFAGGTWEGHAGRKTSARRTKSLAS